MRPEDGRYGIVAGRRRYFALKAIKAEMGEVDAPPCAVMEADDDAEAIELSLLENIARRDPDPMREYETFVRLIKEGRTVDGIAATFGMTAAQVKQRLALGNLLPGIREAYRAEEIDDETVRHLTMASASQQRKWLRLYKDPEQYAPRGYQLKQWLFGGQQIATAHALFPLTDYTGQIVQDLFGEESYFADADLFWALQNRAIADKREALLKAGWQAVDVLEIGQRFAEWEHVKTPKTKGGAVFVTVAHDGAVKSAQRLAEPQGGEQARQGGGARGGQGRTQAARTSRPDHQPWPAELSRSASPCGGAAGADRAVRARRCALPSRICWRPPATGMSAPIRRPRARTRSAPASRAVPHRPRSRPNAHAVHALLGWQAEDEDGFVPRPDTADVFAHLLTLDDADVPRIAAFAMAQSLAAGSDVVEAVGADLRADARGVWQADETFFDLIRDRATVNAVLGDVAGETVARANVAEKAKVQKQIIRDCLSGANGRTKDRKLAAGLAGVPGAGCRRED